MSGLVLDHLAIIAPSLQEGAPHARLGIVDPPEVREAATFCYRAVIDTPGGIMEID